MEFPTGRGHYLKLFIVILRQFIFFKRTVQKFI